MIGIEAARFHADPWECINASNAPRETTPPAASAAASELISHDGGEQPNSRAREYGRDHRDHARDRSISLPSSAPQSLDFQPAGFRDAE